jgi:DNA-binding response OmpR family regulator
MKTDVPVILLADFNLPGFDAPAALELAKAACPGTPFICVSATIGEEATVELLKQGADDIVLKGRLALHVTTATRGTRPIRTGGR